MKTRIWILLLAVLMLALAACGEKKTLTCDNCGKTVEVAADSSMTEEWTVYCGDCEKALGLDDIA